MFPYRSLLLAACVALAAHAAVAQTVQISEFMASNVAGLLDEDGDAGDWIEIANTGAVSVNLAGWSLTDDALVLNKWIFPAVTLNAGARLVVFASDKDRANPALPLHTNFKLESAGEYLALVRPDLSIADSFSPAYPAQQDDISYGRLGASAGYFQAPTPGAANSALYAGLVGDTHFSVDRGIFFSPFELSLSCETPGAEIRYTLDSSIPTATHGSIAAGPIAIDKTTIVRVSAFKPGWLPADVDTATYLFTSSIFNQPILPAGFPPTWGGSPASNQLMTGDYEMDPEVVQSTTYSGRMMSALTTIPSLSVVMPVDDWFAKATGIYSNGALEGDQWERACSAELINPDGTAGFALAAGVQIQGGTSTQPDWKSPKLSMRVLFKDQYGPSKLRYAFFPDSGVEEFDSLVLDAGLSTWTHPTDITTRVRAQYIRDNFINDLQLALGHPSPHNRYVHLFLNGLYWGLYYVHERPDEHFLHSYLGGDEDNYDVIRHVPTDIVAGSNAGYLAMMAAARAGLSDQAVYESFVNQNLDLASFIDYMLLNFWAGNTDWAHHNWFAGRDRTGGSGFQFFAWDSEHVLESVTDDLTAKNNSGAPTELYQLLKANAEFRMTFADRAYKAFFNNGVLSPAGAWGYYTKRAQEIDTAVIMESARWGDHRRDQHPVTLPADLYTRDAHWLAEQARLRDAYFPARTGIVVQQLRARGIYPSIDPPMFTLNGEPSNGGPAFTGSVAALANPNSGGVIYYTIDGSDPRQPATGSSAAIVSPAALAYLNPIGLNQTTRIRARVLRGAEWSAIHDAIFSFATPRENLRIVRIMYHPPDAPAGNPDAEFIEFMNVGFGSILLNGIHFSAGVDFTFPNLTLKAGERIRAVLNLAAYQSQYGTHGNIAGQFASGKLDNAGERLTLVDAQGAAIQDFVFDDDWFPSTDGDGKMLELINPQDPIPANWGLAASWRAATVIPASSSARNWLQYDHW